MLICEILVSKVEGVERMRKEGKEGEGGKEEGGRKEGRVEGWRMKERKREGRKEGTYEVVHAVFYESRNEVESRW